MTDTTYLLWGRQALCAEYAARQKISRQNWRHISADSRGSEQLRGLEGPHRHPESKLVLLVIPGQGWRPTAGELSVVRSRGFEPEVVDG